MTVDHDAPEPVYAQLAGILRAQIADGTLPPRSRLPSLNDLAEQHEVAVTTVQKVVGILKDEGLVVTHPGRGAFVR